MSSSTADPAVDAPHENIDSKLPSLECFDPHSGPIDLPLILQSNCCLYQLQIHLISPK